MLSLISSLIGGLFGGILRLAPEVLKFLDAKNDRQHELDMQDKQLAFLQAQGTLKVQEAQIQTSADVQKGQFDAYMAAYKAENTMLANSSPWVNNVNALIRPSVTFGVFTLWTLCRLAVIAMAYKTNGGDAITVLSQAWTADDAALMSMISSFYFVGRTIEKKQ